MWCKYTFCLEGYEWGWILGTGMEKSPYVCEISKEDIYKISQEDRGPGEFTRLDNPDEETIERGPKMLEQPKDVVYEPKDVNKFTSIICTVDAYPEAEFSWTRERAGDKVEIDPNTEPRYTMINGVLIIHEPAADEEDDGKYQCTATNKFGSIFSNTIALDFGYLQDFPKSPRAPVSAIAYQWASVECSPPAHYPEVLYTWYKDDIYNFIRPELKPYIFISNDGRLYFSEITADDVGAYYCLIYKPGQALAEGKVSMPTEVKVVEGSPGIYEPEIGSGFPLVYPSSPMIGDNVRLECWASGTSRYDDLIYTWDKVEMVDGKPHRELPLPNQARLTDHMRVLLIDDIQLYDEGTYRCNVRRLHGQSHSETVDLILQGKPYFTLNLKDQFADIGTDLTWRCQAGGNPSPQYHWLKNTEILSNDTIPEEDRGRIIVNNNVLIIRNLDPERDNGMYQCQATNMLGTEYSTGELRVLSFAPNFKKYLMQPNQFATALGNTTLYCRPEAAPYPSAEEIIWYKNGVPLNPGSGENDRVQQLPNGNVFISNVQQSDQGVYKCHVSNSYGEAETVGNLTVLSKSTTTLTQPPLDTNIQVNRTNFLSCMASYNPVLDVTYVWYHGDMLVEFEKVFRLYVGGLYIMKAQFEHQGRYTCRVHSSSGMTAASATVQILGPPSEPAGVFIQSATVTTSSVVVQWKASGTTTRPIISYVIEGYNFWEGFWRILFTSEFISALDMQLDEDERETMHFNVTDLRPYSTYQLRIRAENSYGTSIPSTPSQEFTTWAVKPDRAPEEVGGGGGRVGDLTITWKPLEEWEYNGPGIGYRVRRKNRGDDEWDKTFDIPGGDISRYVDLVGEPNFYREYEVTAQAYNDQGFGPVSPISIIRSAMGLPTVIAQNVRAQPFNSTACLVHWEPVEDSRDHIKGKLGGYRLSYWKECCETEEMAPRVTIDGQASEGLVIGLEPNTPYYFDVMVWNQAGNGPKSQYFIQRTLRTAPINMPVEVQVLRKSGTAIEVSFRGVSTTSEEEPLEGYKVRIWADGEHLKVGEDYDSGKETTLYIDDLRSDVMYKLRAYGYSRGGMGTMSSPAVKFMLGSAAAVSSSITLIVTLCVFNRLFLS
ncbi:hypothetical protein CAPTEDRAFT_180331 [Capitella teleta]|uniref:Contactin n=1 Tax=Capitella teleta TaxID=283909 RepID=R7TA26_CAPTE|nr:hypothetical protein CAPTEDRAFT_180331 [Capitella teleta]|eukprot:ELT90327.1 hypothetical protein CAPTEDRAFT_180331 [Capitella teleta]